MGDTSLATPISIVIFVLLLLIIGGTFIYKIIGKRRKRLELTEKESVKQQEEELMSMSSLDNKQPGSMDEDNEPCEEGQVDVFEGDTLAHENDDIIAVVNVT